MAGMNNIDDILGDVLASLGGPETLGGKIPEEVARDFLIAHTIAVIGLEQNDISALYAPMLMAASLGAFIGKQDTASLDHRRKALEIANRFIFHAYARSANDQAWVESLSKPPAKGKRRHG